MKKIIGTIFLLVLTMQLAYVASVSAATEILVEGENYKSITSGKAITGVTGASGNALWLFDYPYTPYVKLKQQMAVYEVDVPEAGTYTVYADASVPKESARSDWSIIVNDEEPLLATMDAENLGIKELSKYNGIIYKIKAGSAWFNKGTNTIRFELDMSDVNYISTIQCAIDCIRLVKDDFGIERVKPKELGNIFEQKFPIVYDILYKGESYEEHTFKYEIEDFWSNIVTEGEIVSAPAARRETINFGKFETGWYIFRIYSEDGSTVVVNKPFAVVPDYDKRTTVETPYAADCGAEMRVAHGEQAEAVVRSMKLAGIRWVRDRLGWANTERTKGKRTDHLDDFLDLCQKSNIDVLNADTELPTWTDIRDLFTAYKYYKEQAALYKDRIDCWEILNEYDSNFGHMPGDVYSAYFKAIAIAIEDSGSNAATSMNSLAMKADSNMFLDLMMKNELMKFSDVYNFHAHTTLTDNRNDSFNMPKVETYFDNEITHYEDKPMWNSEQGMFVPLVYGSEPSIEQKRGHARYYSTSTCQSLANGIDKTFWFLWRTYIEGINDMSIYNSDKNEPTAAYTSCAILSYILGEANMKGILDIEEGEGYVFDSGKEDVLAVWTDMPRSISLHANTDVTVTDIMGQSRTVTPVNGMIEVEISHYPVYVRYGGEMPLDDYYPKSFNRPALKSVGNYTPAERVVIAQEFIGQDFKTVKTAGYTLQDKKNAMNLLIYNLNDKDMTGTIHGNLDGYDIVIENPTVSVPAMSKITVPVTLVLRDDDENEYMTRYLSFYMDFDGEKSTESVSTVKVVKEAKNLGEAPEIPFNEIMDPNNWNQANRSEGSGLELENVDGVLKLAFTNTPVENWSWIYPQVKLDNPQAMAETNGLVFEYKTAPESIGPGGYNVFLYTKDGREYYLGAYTTYTPSETWKRVEVTWDDFVLYKTPLGIYETRSLDVTELEAIAIGGNFQIKDHYYEFRNIGFLKKAETEDAISISGIDGDIENITDASKLSNVKITMDEKFDMSKTRVLIEDVEIEDVSRDGNVLTVDLSYLTKGEYLLRIIGVDKDKHYTLVKKSFRIE